MDLKSTLKSIKLNESTISMALGALVILVVGVFVVNYFKDVGDTTLPGVSVEIEEESADTYTVARGENLWLIAARYYGDGNRWVEIAKANNFKDAGKIEVGQRIKLPDLPKTDTVQVTAETPQNIPLAISGATYEVVRGDNLWTIAVRAYGDGFRWVEIARENNLVNPNLIHAGNILILPR